MFPSPSPSSLSNYSSGGYENIVKARLASKLGTEYKDAQALPQALLAQQAGVGPARPGTTPALVAGQKRKAVESANTMTGSYIDDLDRAARNSKSADPFSTVGTVAAHGQLVTLRRSMGSDHNIGISKGLSDQGEGSTLSNALIRKRDAASRAAQPTYHPQWKLSRVISGHLGWVRCVAVEPGNKWFATGAGDRMIKVRHAWQSEADRVDRFAVISRNAEIETTIVDLVCTLSFADLGYGFGRIEALAYWPHIDC